jgi:UDP-N-acetylmuramate--alanine ligase
MKEIKKVHFIGIKGQGMTALALFCRDKGLRVTGSDIAEEFPTDSILKKAGISWKAPFSASNVPKDCDLVIATIAHNAMTDNPETVAARAMGKKVVSYGQALGMFAQDYRVIAVAGTHGKTTTSAMIALILEKAGLSPSWIVGWANVSDLGVSGRGGKGKWLVLEADEYIDRPIDAGGKPKFLYLAPDIAVITSVEWDHPDAFPSEKSFQNAFKKFLKQVKSNGLVVMFGDSAVTRRLGKSTKAKVWWYGAKRLWPHLKLSVPGLHNRLNATAAARVAHELGVDQKTIISALSEFHGVGRRLEEVGEWQGVILIDDYAHHPTAIETTLAAAKEKYPGRRIVVLFQPHTYSRTKALLSDFSKAFSDADRVFIMDIFASAREKGGDVTSADLVAETKKHHKAVSRCSGDLKTVAEAVRKELKPGDIFVTMGATKVYEVHDILREHGQNKPR